MSKKQNGRSMVEVIGVIGVMAVLGIGAIKAIDYGMGFYRAHEVKVVAEEMIKKIEQFAVWERGYDHLEQNGFNNNGSMTYFCEKDGLDFPKSFCSGNNVNASKLEVKKGKITTNPPSQGDWSPNTDGSSDHFVLIFTVGRETCRQLRKAANGTDLKWKLSGLRQVSPFYWDRGRLTPFCSKYYTNKFAFQYPAD